MKFVIFKEVFFSDTQFFNEMFEKSNVHEENVQKIVILIAKCPKNGEFQGIFFFASFSLRRIFFAENAKKFFFASKGPRHSSDDQTKGSFSQKNSESLAFQQVYCPFVLIVFQLR